MKKIITTIILIVICLSFVGCDLNIASVDGLMHPPKLSGENSLLQQTFESIVGSDGIVMKTPISGEYRSSYLLYDLDGDDIAEALVLYSDTSKDAIAFVTILKYVGKEWKFVSTIKGRSEEIYEVDFADINGDNTYEIVISWVSTSATEKINSTSLGESNNRNLTVYSYNGSSTTLIKTETYTKLLIEDFNNDNAEELFVVNISFSNYEKLTSGRIISFNNDYSIDEDVKFTLTGVTEIFNIVTDSYTVNDEVHSRIYVDGSVSENGFITEIIDISHSTFEVSLPFYESNISSNPLTLRNVRVFSQDIDNDGFIEIPTLESLVAGVSISEKSEENSQLNLTVWSQVNENQLSVEIRSLFNGTYDYMFIYPTEWIGKITAVYNDSDETITFYEIDENQTFLKSLFSIKTVFVDDWHKNDYGYTKFDENSVYVYGYLILDNENKEIYIDALDSNFVLLNNN